MEGGGEGGGMRDEMGMSYLVLSPRFYLVAVAIKSG